MLKREAADLRLVIKSAARWLALIESGRASARDHAELTRWRESDARHEQAWQQAQRLRQRFDDLPPELAMRSLDRPEQSRRRVLKGIFGIAALGSAAWLVSKELPVAAWRADIATATGERRTLSLADGSVLELNTASAVDVDPGSRRLTLVRGEIALRLGSAQAYRIEAGGERADVRSGQLCARREGQVCEFSVLEGLTDVHLRDRRLQLSAGQRVRVRDGQLEWQGVFDPSARGWRDGVLMADDQPLGDFLRELDRYRPGILRWAPELEAWRVTGSFRLDDPEQILDLLAASLPLEIQRRTRYWVTLRKREKIV